ncbi:MAG TPA: hypothetical protein VF849_01565 [Blattabacteriaceae bacterium]
MKYLISLFLVLSLSAAGPVQVAFDSQVVNWNYRCSTNNIVFTTTGLRCSSTFNKTISLIASSVWMGGIRTSGLYPGNILRANLMCGGSYESGGGCGTGTTAPNQYNIGSPQIPLINDTGNGLDICVNSGLVDAYQARWKYTETGSSGGLGCLTSNVWVAFDTGVIPNNVSSWQSDVHACVYMMGGASESADELGVYNPSTLDKLIIYAVHSAAGQLTRIWSDGSAAISADTNGTGFYLGTKTSASSNGVKQYHNNSLTATSAAVAGNSANLTTSIYVFCQNNLPNMSPFQPEGMTTHLMGGYALGRAITATQNTNYYTLAWQPFETLLNRQK